MKRFKRRAVFLATNLETLGMIPFFGSWPLQYKMLSAGPVLRGICVSRPRAPALAPCPKFVFHRPGPQFVFSPALSLCSPVLRFTVKVCYSYSVYLYKLSVYLYVPTC